MANITHWNDFFQRGVCRLTLFLFGMNLCFLYPALAQKQTPAPPTAPQKQDAEAKETLEKWAAAYKNAVTLQYTAAFLYAPQTAGETPQKVVIHFQQKRPNLLRAEVTAPHPADNAVLVSDGKILWEYCPATKQYKKTPVPHGPLLIQGELAGLRYVLPSLFFHPDPKDALLRGVAAFHLKKSADKNPHKAHQAPLILVRQQEDSFNFAWLDPKDYLPRRVLIFRMRETEAVEVLREERSDVRINAPIDDKIFTLALPADAKQLTAAGPEDLLLKPGTDAPDFTVKDAKGADVRFASLHGKMTLLIFWADWNPVCRTELAQMARMSAEAGMHGLTVVGVNCWDRPDAVRDYLEACPDSPLSLWRDPAKNRPESVAFRLYGVRGLPTSYLIAPDGKILHGWIGYDDHRSEEIRAAMPK